MSKVRVAYLGTGGIAGRHVLAMKDRVEVEIVAGCDVREQVVTDFFAKHLVNGQGAVPAFVDPAEMYKQTAPDAVVICTPHTLHYEQAMQALEAGCHVMMEKPMVTSADHAYAIRDKVAETGKVFTIAYNTPCTPTFHWLRERMREQVFGRLELISGYISQDWRRGTMGTWRQDPSLSGGGQAYDSGAHLLNSLCWTVESRVAEVFAFVDNLDTPVDINSVMSVRFENDAFASITVGGNCPGGSTHMAMFFDAGRVEIDGWGGRWLRAWDAEGKAIEEAPDGAPDLSPAGNFLDAVLGLDQPRTSPENGVIHSELMDAIYESARTGVAASPKRR